MTKNEAIVHVAALYWVQVGGTMRIDEDSNPYRVSADMCIDMARPFAEACVRAELIKKRGRPPKHSADCVCKDCVASRQQQRSPTNGRENSNDQSGSEG